MCGVPFSNITGCKRIPTDFIFLASSQLTTSIHWPWYCTGHVFVVIYFCESMWSFWVDVNLAMFLLSCIFVRVYGLFEWMWIWPCFCCHLFLWEYVVFLSGCESGHVFVVIYFCESMWSFWVDVNLAMFIIVCLYMYCRWKSSYEEGGLGSY